MRIRFWGVRGTIPAPGPDTVRLGGNTACLDVLTSDKQLIVIDAGSGIRRLGIALAEEFPGRIVGTVLVSHTHWDHIQGFPFFAPLIGPHSRQNRFVIVGQKRVGRQLENVLAGQIIEPYLPFAFKELAADIHVKEVSGGEKIVIGDDTIIRVAELRHPGGCLGFRIENNGHVFTYCTDSSHEEDHLTENVLKLAQGADLLVHDAQYSLEQRKEFPDYGHSSWLEAVKVAQKANVGCLALFHYDPNASDDYMESVLLKARELFPHTILSQEGLELDLPVSEEKFL
ncbi:MAG: MBL fold metallo-hydrolase [Candidatus Promineifilaceae bacterium]